MKTQNSADGSRPAFSHLDQADKQVDLQPQPHTAEAIQAWLISRLTKELKIDPQDINVEKHFSRYGLDSLTTVALICDLEDWLGRSLPDTLVEDYPTIETLAWHLAGGADMPAEQRER